MKAQLTLGVIGHVDHGKTALVHALTGIETDRLKEEKERGLSIVLGFSYMEGSQASIDLIDVPGHEDFVRTMVSGATGMDGALLVVAANEAIMPQTREHLAIADLLGVDRGIVVITKRDLVSGLELERTIEKVGSFTAGTFLEDAEVVCTSVSESLGICELRDSLDRMKPVENRESSNLFPFLPIDRAFVMPGFGLVVTGTLRGGYLTTQSTVELLPSKRAVTIRGLQVHSQAVDLATSGQRVAVNLRHVKREEVNRGDVLVAQDRINATSCIDVDLRLLESHAEPLKDGATVEFLTGTTNVMAKVRLLNRKRLEPGVTGFAQLRFQRSIATYPTQRFIVRSVSPMRTIGGGKVLEPHPNTHRRFDDGAISRLKTIAHGNTVEKVQMILAEADVAGSTCGAISELLHLSVGDVRAALKSVRPESTETGLLIDRLAYATLVEKIRDRIARHHEQFPRHSGIAAERILGQLHIEPSQEVFQHAISHLLSAASIERHGGTLRLAGFDPFARLTQSERQLAAEMEADFRARQLALTYVHQVEDTDQIRQDVFQLLCDSHRLVRIKKYGAKSDMVVHVENYDKAIAKIVAAFTYPKEFTVSEVRELIGANRRFTVPFMEHLDAEGITTRMGNLRQLRTQIGQLSEEVV